MTKLFVLFIVALALIVTAAFLAYGLITALYTAGIGLFALYAIILLQKWIGYGRRRRSYPFVV
jgi:hypothetical protein